MAYWQRLASPSPTMRTMHILATYIRETRQPDVIKCHGKRPDSESKTQREREKTPPGRKLRNGAAYPRLPRRGCENYQPIKCEFHPPQTDRGGPRTTWDWRNWEGTRRGHGRLKRAKEGRDRIAPDGCCGDECQLLRPMSYPQEEWHGGMASWAKKKKGAEGAKGCEEVGKEYCRWVQGKSEWFLSPRCERTDAQPLRPMRFACLAMFDGWRGACGERSVADYDMSVIRSYCTHPSMLRSLSFPFPYSTVPR